MATEGGREKGREGGREGREGGREGGRERCKLQMSTEGYITGPTEVKVQRPNDKLLL